MYVFGMFPRFLEELLENVNLVCSATVATKTALGIIQLWLNYSATFFYKPLGMHFSRETNEIDATVVGAFTSLLPTSLCMRMINLPFHNAMPIDTHESAKSSGVLSPLIHSHAFPTQLWTRI